MDRRQTIENRKLVVSVVEPSKIVNRVSVLFTCIGRRVSLLESFRRAARQLKLNASFFGTDTTELSSALQLCDKRFIVKPTAHPRYIAELLSIVRANKVKLLVPTVDLDLRSLSRNKAKFAALGCRVLVSEPKVIAICQDKRKTYKFLLQNNFATPVTLSIQTALKNRSSSLVPRPSSIRFPLFVKPWDGSASRGNAVVNNRQELLFYAKRIPNAICQEFVRGAEHTCDVYIDFDMKVRCVVPRRRIEIRAGEVSKSQVVKDPRIMAEAGRLVEKLSAGPGVVTVQLFLTDDDRIKFIEINPRFGGGAPLSIKAGANFPKWILQELTGRKPTIRPDNFKDGLIMLRYDSEVWLEG
jgi:carbamoyl-phosphate synthase large subunit